MDGKVHVADDSSEPLIRVFIAQNNASRAFVLRVQELEPLLIKYGYLRDPGGTALFCVGIIVLRILHLNSVLELSTICEQSGQSELLRRLSPLRHGSEHGSFFDYFKRSMISTIGFETIL